MITETWQCSEEHQGIENNQGIFTENQQPAFENIKAKKDKVKLHKVLLTLLQMLGNKMKSRLEQSLDPAFVKDEMRNYFVFGMWHHQWHRWQVQRYQLGHALTDCIVW